MLHEKLNNQPVKNLEQYHLPKKKLKIRAFCAHPRVSAPSKSPILIVLILQNIVID